MKKNLVNNILVGAVALLVTVGAANAATSVEGGGKLVLNIDQTIFNTMGTPSDYSLYIEHYFDAATANVTEGPDLISGNLGNLDEIENYDGLEFAVQNFGLPGAVIGTQHQLQGTHFLFNDPNNPVGQIGFGGVLRLSTFAVGTSTNTGFGEIGVGDFTLTKVDRSDTGAVDASGWLITTTSGIKKGKYRPLFDTKNVTAHLMGEPKMLHISGDLLWAPEAIAFLSSKDSNYTHAGTFSVMANIAEAVTPGDVNGSGAVDITDIVSIINLVLGTGQSKPASDCNQDGEFDILDIVCSINFVLAE